MSAGSAFGMLGQALRRAFGVVEGDALEVRRAQASASASPAASPAPWRRRAWPRSSASWWGRRSRTTCSSAPRGAIRSSSATRCAAPGRTSSAPTSAARPLVLVLEDLHWGDLPTVKLVDAALRHLETRPLLVLAMGRPEVHQLFPDLWAGRGVAEVHLARLPRGAGERLVRGALGAAVSAGLVAGLVERADGNAFYLEELIRAVAEGKGAELPETVLAMVQARLEALDVEERRVLRAASVFGQRFREGGVAALLGGAKARGWLRALADQELVVAADEGPGGGAAGYRFRHALVREAAYGMLTEADRVLGHRLAGEWLEAAGETRRHGARRALPARRSSTRAPPAGTTAPPSTPSRATTWRPPSPAPSAASPASKTRRAPSPAS